MQYFGKGPGFVEPWLSTKTGGGGGGGCVRDTRTETQDAIRRSGALILI